MNPVLAIKNVDVAIDRQVILTNIEFALDSGEILGLVGPSGCGKTTLLNTIAGFIPQTKGDICIEDDIVINTSHMLAPEKRKVGMIFQDYALFPHLTISQNIRFGIKALSKEEQLTRVDELLSLLALDGLADRFPHQLSGGQQQRVAIARAIAPRPKLLLLDEPFSNIDARLRHSLMLELRQLFKSQNITAIFVTHNKDEVFTFADKMAVMAAGNILQFDAPSAICAEPANYQVADFLQLGSWLPCRISENTIATQLGSFPIAGGSNNISEGDDAILIKPQNIDVSASNEGQLKVTNISVTEQGYHYYLASCEQDSELAIEHLSVYSPEIYELNQPVNVSVRSHAFLTFTTK